MALALIMLQVAFSQAMATTGGERSDGLTALTDVELSSVTGQSGSLFLSDRIGPNELANPDPGGLGGASNFTFHRMGLDARLDLNVNISKLQLGCGGINDALTGPGCDIDIDYFGLMGLNNTLDRPGDPLSDFTMIRPYVELAVKNDNTPSREIVGIKIGAERINGAIRMGRDYTGVGALGPEPNMLNQEHGGTCNPGATAGQGVVNCHSGINQISGNLAGLEMSAGFEARARICTVWPCAFGIGVINVNIDGCLGRINFGNCDLNSDPFFIDAGGTRLDRLHVAAAELDLTADVIIPINLSGYGQLDINTRLIHYLLAPDSSDFFISFQRERVAYPRYEKAPPPSNIPYDACNPAYGSTTARCSSGYAPAANTGWWLNASGLKMLNILPADRIQLPGTLQWTDLISALGPNSNITIRDPKLDLVAAPNCYGGAAFC